MRLLPKRLKEKLAKLSPQELEILDVYLHQLIAKAWRREHAKAAAEDAAKAARRPAVVYRKEYVHCGKPGCKCAEGQPHGPYWYAYYRSPKTGRVVSKYLGKRKSSISSLGDN